jgi:RimJ/RimL family protein N-acetyltransferase
MQFVEPIQSERLSIRPLRPGDFDRHFAIYSNPDVVRFLYEEAFDAQGAREHLKRRSSIDLPTEGSWVNLGVELLDEDILIGEVGLALISVVHGHCEIGYVFDPAYAGNGYATEASAVMVELAFSALGAHRVSGRLDARNDASARVLERLGMRREGHFVENEYVKGEWTDEAVYAVLEDEWRALRGPARAFHLRT